EVDDLAEVGETAEEGAEAGVIEARAAMDQQQRGLLAQHGPLGHQAEALDGAKEADAGLDLDVHGVSAAFALVTNGDDERDGDTRKVAVAD
ncbi:hypothetical protein, partial [Klebsiella pneumoniae]|uniref:hypothetical protein n=1 Tax=Klebsiella pneumoniae TaxID=573 RepID=UPI0013D00334